MYELGQCHAIIEAISTTPLLPEFHENLLEVSLTQGAQATTAIEGNTLSLEEVRRVFEGKSLAPSKEYQEIEVRNILAGFNLILKEALVDDRVALVSPDLLLRFHGVIGRDLGEYFDAIPGQLRMDRRSVGPYLTPDHDDVPELLSRLCDWLREEFRYGRGQTMAEAIVQAIVAHVYIEWIHPFGDGNGRSGRLVEFYVLIRAGCPDIASHLLSNHYNNTRPEYYKLLDRASKERDLTCFLEYAIRGFRDGLLGTLQQVQASQFAMSWRKLVHDRFAQRPMTNKNSFARQRVLMLELPPNPVTVQAARTTTPAIEALYSQVGERTLRRDLEALEQMGLVLREGGTWRLRLELLRTGTARRRIAAAEASQAMST